MRTIVFFSFIIAASTLLVPFACLAQNPKYIVTVVADGKPLNLSQGISLTTKTLDLTAQLTQESLREYPQLKPNIAINKAILNLVRDTKRVGYLDWSGEESIVTLLKEAKKGDRLVIQLEDVKAQTKKGVAQKVNDDKIIQISIQE
ncbi:hypothetical protein [Spirosoma koreense]